MGKPHKPVAGSRAFVPRKRAKSKKSRVRSWPESEGSKVNGFVGYKAGMTHVIALDDRKGRVTAGMEIFVPVTIVDTPPLNVFGFRAYIKAYGGIEAVADVLTDNPPKELSKSLSLPKKITTQDKIKELKEKITDLSDIRLLVSTQPQLTSLPQKKPDVMELGLSGSVQEKFDYAIEQLGKQLSAKDVFQDNSFVDVLGITKGKGFQGVIKRYGVQKQPRKSTQKRRHIGSGGPINPSKKLWVWPTPGQHGYHSRIEYNKAILKAGSDGKEVTPAGGFLHYGPVKGDYLIIKGSLPGPAKRLLRLTSPRRQKEESNFSIVHIDVASKQGVA